MLRSRFPVAVRNDALLDTINQKLSCARIFMSDAEIRENLAELDDFFEGIDYRGVNGVIRKLKNKLAKDKDSDRR